MKLKDMKLKEGQLIWVKDREWKHWVYGRFIKFNDNGCVNVSILGRVRDIDCYEEYTTLNPYPDSMESRAIRLVRELMDPRKYGVVDFYRVDEFLEEIDRVNCNMSR
jgi:hypothetical protein